MGPIGSLRVGVSRGAIKRRAAGRGRLNEEGGLDGTMPDSPPAGRPPESPEPPVDAATSHRAEVARLPSPVDHVAPRQVARGVVIFDLDGTILDSIGRISDLAGDVLFQAFGTPPAEGRIHYLATTGMPFEAQLAQLYPDVPAARRAEVARGFHQRKVREAYADATPFPEVPKVMKRLDQDGWTLVVSTGAEREMADLILEREGLRFWFEEVLGSSQGTKREHLQEYRRRYPATPFFLIGDSRFDMEAAASLDGVRALGRASRLPGWTLTPDDLRRWGAVWADYTLAPLPDVLNELITPSSRRHGRARRRPGSTPRGKGRDRDSPKSGVGPASV